MIFLFFHKMWILLVMLILFIFSIFETVLHGGKKRKPDELYLGEEWFAELKSGNKTLDIRPGNNKQLMDFVGSSITYYHKKDTIKVKLVKINKYDNLDDLIKGEDTLAISPHFKTKAAAEKNLKEYYTAERVKDMGGLLVLHIKK